MFSERFRADARGQDSTASAEIDRAGSHRQAIWSNMWVWFLLGTGYLVGQATWEKPDFTVTALFIAGPFTAAMFYARVSEINSKLSRAILLLEKTVILAEKGEVYNELRLGSQQKPGLPLSRSDRRWAEAMANILRTRNEGEENDLNQGEERPR